MGDLDEISSKIQPFIRQISAWRIGLRIYRAVFFDQRFFLYLAKPTSLRSHPNAAGIRWVHVNAGTQRDSSLSICHAKQFAKRVSYDHAHTDCCVVESWDPFARAAVTVWQRAAHRQNCIHLFHQPD